MLLSELSELQFHLQVNAALWTVWATVASTGKCCSLNCLSNCSIYWWMLFSELSEQQFNLQVNAALCTGWRTVQPTDKQWVFSEPFEQQFHPLVYAALWTVRTTVPSTDKCCSLNCLCNSSIYWQKHPKLKTVFTNVDVYTHQPV